MFRIPIAPFPSPDVQSKIPPAKWKGYLETSTTALSLHLSLPLSRFTSDSLRDASLVDFLTAYLSNSQALSAQHPPLRRKAFQTLHRIYAECTPHVPPALTTVSTLTGVSQAFGKSRTMRELFSREDVWSLFEKDVLKSGVGDSGSVFRFSQRAAVCLLAGDEWVEGVVASGDVRALARALVAVAGARDNWRFLGDVLYRIVGMGKGGRKTAEFLKRLVWDTMVADVLETCIDELGGDERIMGVLVELRAFGPGRRKAKGKEKAVDIGRNQEGEEEEEERLMKKVAEVTDILSHLGSGFVRRCLLAMDKDVERVTSAILEGSLPGDLSRADREEEFIPPEGPSPPSVYTTPPSGATSPRPLPARRNIFDNDDLDRLVPSLANRLHRGNKANAITADSLLSTSGVSKDAVYSALAAFDSDEDERDDTYDTADIGGAVDTSGPPGDEADDGAEEALWTAYKQSPEVFGRDADTRRGKPRAELREKTGMTNEALEGWKSMLERDPGRLRALERRFADEAGACRAFIPRTSWTAGDEDGGRGLGRGRGRGGRDGGGRGRGGNVAGPNNEKETQQARAKKDANKASRANHNRKDGRARKMARGGFAV